MTPRPPARAADAGFTLVEVLIALSALALLAVGAIGLTTFAANSREQLARHDDEARALLRLHTLLRADLGQAVGRRPRDAKGAKPQSALMATNADRDGAFLSLVRLGWDNPTGQNRSSLQAVEYSLENGVILRRHRRHVDGSPLQPPQVLLAGVRSASVQFFTFDQWVDGWTGAPDRPLPRAFRLVLDFEDDTRLEQLFLLPEAGR